MPIRTKNTRVDDAYLRLKSQIVKSKLAPGFQCPEPEIAQLMGMSRTPVREALIRLESDGLIELVPRRGVRVLGISMHDLVEIYELLAVLEAQAMSGLARQKLAPADLEKFEEPIRKMGEAFEGNDIERGVREEDNFRRLLLDLTENERLAKIVACLYDQVFRANIVLLKYQDGPVVTAQDYRDLVAAILSGNASRAHEIAYSCRKTAQDVFRGLFSSNQLSEI